MISVLPVTRIITFIAVSYAALVALFAAAIWPWTDTNINSQRIISWALSGGTILQIILIFVISFAWRKIWRLIPGLNLWVFPDLNGKWDMTIEWHGPVAGGSGKLEATADIKLDLLKISIGVISKNSTSHTLSVTAQRDSESGHPRLIYVFRVEPRAVSGPDGIPYRAAAVLNQFYDSDEMILHGKYWTERQTVGNYTLRRTNSA